LEIILVSIESTKNDNNKTFLKNALKTRTGIKDHNKTIVLSLLSRSEVEIRADGMSETIMTLIDVMNGNELPQTVFRHRLRRILQSEEEVVYKEVETNEEMKDNNEDMIITEHILSSNIHQIMTESSSLIDITEDLDQINLFSLIFRLLRTAFEAVDHILVVSLVIMFFISLVFNHIYFRPNSILLYRNLFDIKTVRLCLQFIQVLSFVRIMSVINGYHNYKMWSKLLKIIDPDFPSDQNKYLKKNVKPTVILIITLTIESNYNHWKPESLPPMEPTLMTSVVRPLMAIFSFLTLIRHNTNVIQIFFIVLHFLSRQYLQELQSYLPLYESEYSLLMSVVVVMMTTKTILNYKSLYLVIIPNLLVHTLISFSDFTSETISSIIPLNIHLIFF
jgi:hypothetical protein